MFNIQNLTVTATSFVSKAGQIHGKHFITYIVHDVKIGINYGELKKAQALGTVLWYV